MNQRRKQPVVTRQQILDAAGTSFSLHGYAGTGLNPIVAAAGLTKGALFHHFPDKRALVLAWIAGDLTDAVRALWVSPLEGIDSLDALRSFCRTRCLGLRAGDALSALVSLTAETAAADELLGGALEQVFATWREALASVLERGQSAGWIHRGIQPAVEAGLVASVFSGFTVTTKANPDEGFRRICAAGLEAYLETLRPQ